MPAVTTCHPGGYHHTGTDALPPPQQSAPRHAIDRMFFQPL